MTRPPHESPELEKADFVHLDSCVGLDAPTQIWAAPWRETMAAGGNPDEAQDSFHDFRSS